MKKIICKSMMSLSSLRKESTVKSNGTVVLPQKYLHFPFQKRKKQPKRTNKPSNLWKKATKKRKPIQVLLRNRTVK